MQQGLKLSDLRCPDCHASLAAPEACASCGLRFPVHDDRRRMMATRRRELTLQYDPSDRLLPPDEVMRFPPRSGQHRGEVYHLDIAHADALAELPPGSRVLEVGCGGGQMRGWVRHQGLDYVGIDIADDRVHDRLREHGGPDLFADAHALPFVDGSFDAVYSVAVWEHLTLPPLATAEAARVLRPGGLMLGSMSFLEPWHDASQFHMTPSAIDRTLRQAGLRPRLIWPELRWPAFKSIMEMGNKATRAVRGIGWLAYGWYLAPKAAQVMLRQRRMPAWNDLYHPVANTAGAIAWIADKPGAQDEAGAKAPKAAP